MDGKTLQRIQHRKLTVKTQVGDVVLTAEYGLDPETRRMVMPLREALDLQGHQPLSPVMEDRLCHLAITTTSYEKAAEVARRFGLSTDANQIRRLAQRAGERAEAQAAQRVAAAFDLRQRKEIIRQAGRQRQDRPFSMVLMLDGTMLRSRGKDWGMKPASAVGDRVAWHELKAGLVLCLPEGGLGGKRRDPEKYYVASDGDPESVGRRLYAEALRRGLEQARRVYVIADGAAWIWNVSSEHFPRSRECLDFYHASEHLWSLGRALWGEDEAQVRSWVVSLRSRLRHFGGEAILPLLEALLSGPAERLDEGRFRDLTREVSYFRNHRSRLDYPGSRREGFPVGSGAMESACSQFQGRFKRPGQFWSRLGERRLLNLELAWRNGDWAELWMQTA
jgi:hypothetical protein